jgi:hypothetical protein
MSSRGIKTGKPLRPEEEVADLIFTVQSYADIMFQLNKLGKKLEKGEEEQLKQYIVLCAIEILKQYIPRQVEEYPFQFKKMSQILFDIERSELHYYENFIYAALSLSIKTLIDTNDSLFRNLEDVDKTQRDVDQMIEMENVLFQVNGSVTCPKVLSEMMRFEKVDFSKTLTQDEVHQQLRNAIDKKNVNYVEELVLSGLVPTKEDIQYATQKLQLPLSSKSVLKLHDIIDIMKYHEGRRTKRNKKGRRSKKLVHKRR